MHFIICHILILCVELANNDNNNCGTDLFHVKDPSPRTRPMLGIVGGVTAGSIAFVICTGILVCILVRHRKIKARELEVGMFDDDPLQDNMFRKEQDRDDSGTVS